MRQRCWFWPLAISLAICVGLVARQAALAGSVLVSNPSWSFVGPQPIQSAQTNFGGAPIGSSFHATGRLTAIAMDPGTPGRFFVGAAGGGLWMTTDGGATFARISSTLDSSDADALRG